MFRFWKAGVLSEKESILKRSSVILTLIVLLVFLFIIIGNITGENSGSAYQTEKVLRSGILLLAAWLLTKLIDTLFLDPINTKRGKVLPNIVKDIIFGIIYFIALIIIITGVYERTIDSIIAFFIGSWAIIGFAAKDVIAEFIQGVSVDLKANFELGDWIKFSNGTIGKIVNMNMMGIEILLPDNTTLFTNNRTLSSDMMINLSKPERRFYKSIEIALEHKVPVAKGQRILLAATLNSPGIFDYDVKVFAKALQENGIVYEVHFSVADLDKLPEIRHFVIQNISDYLNRFDLKICQIDGAIKFIQNPELTKIEANDNRRISEISAKDTLEMMRLLDNCDEKTKQEFSDAMKLRKFKTGQTIAKRNTKPDGIFIIAEGIVDIDIKDPTLRKDELTGEIKHLTNHKIICLVDCDYFTEKDLPVSKGRDVVVKARTDVVLFEVDNSIVKKVIKKCPELAMRINESLAKRLITNLNLGKKG